MADLDEAEKLVNKKLGEMPLATRKGKFTPKVEVTVTTRETKPLAKATGSKDDSKAEAS